MSRNRIKTFSKLHERAIVEKRLVLHITVRLRNRVWQLLGEYNESLGVQRDPNDRWIDNSDIATELVPKLYRLYGVDRLQIMQYSGKKEDVDLKGFILYCQPPQVFDIIQLWYDDLMPERQRSFQRELNEVFEEEACPWCFCERDFFQVDSKFLDERVQAHVLELLDAQSFLGAMEEFVEARNDFTSGDFKGTILNSCKSFESVMKTILGKDGGAADDLIKGLDEAGILDDLPKNLRRPFETKVLQTIPFLRNTLAGHGQGEKVIAVSRELAELCLHLTGAVTLFCIRRHLVINPPAPPAAKTTSSGMPDEDIPF
ncbi:MAG: hypothetical protein JW955_08280 [Sedimentisphaerales bacterium]|nr:hypothetical protein [Sedimentisphaerales bacterium]